MIIGKGFQQLGSMASLKLSKEMLAHSYSRISRLNTNAFSSPRPLPTASGEREPSKPLQNQWIRRHIELTDMAVESESTHMTYEEYKQKNLLSFEEYEKKLKPNYKPDTIKKAYEVYCRSSYKGYLVELEQINPGVIL